MNDGMYFYFLNDAFDGFLARRAYLMPAIILNIAIIWVVLYHLIKAMLLGYKWRDHQLAWSLVTAWSLALFQNIITRLRSEQAYQIGVPVTTFPGGVWAPLIIAILTSAVAAWQLTILTHYKYSYRVTLILFVFSLLAMIVQPFSWLYVWLG